MIEGKVIRINGPIIKATGLGGSGLYDVVEIGEKRLIGEIIRLEGDSATIQIDPPEGDQVIVDFDLTSFR